MNGKGDRNIPTVLGNRSRYWLRASMTETSPLARVCSINHVPVDLPQADSLFLPYRGATTVRCRINHRDVVAAMVCDINPCSRRAYATPKRSSSTGIGEPNYGARCGINDIDVIVI